MPSSPPIQPLVALDPDIQAWKRQPTETLKAFEAFKLYRDLRRNRSLRAVQFELTGTRELSQTVKQWSSAYLWVERVQAWEDYLDTVHLEAQVAKVREMNKAQTAIAVKMRELCDRALDQLEPEHFKPDVLLKFITESFRIERLCRGEPEALLEAKLAETRSLNNGPQLFDTPAQQDAARDAAAAFVVALSKVGKMHSEKDPNHG